MSNSARAPAPKEIAVPPRAPQHCISVWCPSFLGHPSLAGKNLFCISNLLW